MRTPKHKQPAPKRQPPGPAWRAAVAHGCDMRLIEEQLRRTPTERIRALQRALNTAQSLRNAVILHER